MLSPQQRTSRLNEAIAHHKAGRFDRAQAIYRQLAALTPGNAAIFELLGEVAEKQGQVDEAVKHYRRAWQLDEKSVALALRLGAVLMGNGRPSEAETVLRRAAAITPTRPELWNALGFALKLRGRLDDAIAAQQHAVALAPDFVEGWTHLGLTLCLAGRNHDALPCFDRALALRPAHTLARFGRAQALHKTYRTGEAIADYDAVLRATPGHLEARSYRLFALQSSDAITREQLFAEHVAYGCAVGHTERAFTGHDFAPEKRLRVAILSPDLRTHSCAYFLEPLLRHLPAEPFELFLYHDHFLEDDVTERLKRYAAVWRNFVGQPHAAVESAIRADRPDVLIDLSGHVGSQVRLPLFARRLAPVQVTYLGYPDTTGVAAMDYRLTDPIADPEGEADRFATEKLVRFSSVAWVYQPPSSAPDVLLPVTEPTAPITFGCFNTPTKFASTVFKAWARILAAAPGSRLLLKGRDFEQEAVRAHVVAEMSRSGIEASRVELLPRTSGVSEHLSQYARIDVALDTFPYHGTTTTCEALWMGRPVVTLRGDRHASRVGASLLTSVGRSSWIAASTDDYVRIAVEVSADRAGRLAFAQQARTELAGSPLLDGAGQARRWAAALRDCWRARCQAAGSTAAAAAA